MASKGRVYYCDLCDVRVSTQALLVTHLEGKKHKQREKQQREQERLASCSVFVAYLKSEEDARQVEQALRPYGELERVILDKKRFSYAIVEFKDPKCVEELLKNVKHLMIGKSKTTIKPRKTDFTSQKPPEFTDISLADVVSFLRSLPADAQDFDSQISALIQKFGLPKEKVNERLNFAKTLEEYMQQFFVSRVSVRPMGSTVNGLAFAKSDLDLNFEMEQVQKQEWSTAATAATAEDQMADDGDEEMASGSGSHKGDDNTEAMELEDASSILMTTAPEEFKQSPITSDAFFELSAMSQAKLLSRLLNLLRKDLTMVTNVVPILHARCPVVQMTMRDSHLLCELSMQNRLGEVKAGFIRSYMLADTSGTVRKILFALKLWAHCNGLFALPPPTTKKGEQEAKPEWNSYTLSLMAITYLQSAGYAPKMKVRAGSAKVNNWEIDYDVGPFQVQAHRLPSMFKELLNFVLNGVKQPSNVFCVREGALYPKQEFERRFATNRRNKRILAGFKYSLVNMQDPLELVHNVTINVHKPGLALLRKKAMYALVVLKPKKGVQLAAMFDLDSVQQSMAKASQQAKEQKATTSKQPSEEPEPQPADADAKKEEEHVPMEVEAEGEVDAGEPKAEPKDATPEMQLDLGDEPYVKRRRMLEG